MFVRVVHQIAVVAAIFSCALVTAHSAYGAESASVQLTPLVSGSNTAIREKTFKALTNQGELNQLWKRHAAYMTPAPKAPKVNFSKNTVLALFPGSFPNPLWGFKVLGATRGTTKNSIVVRWSVVEGKLKPGMAAPAMIVTPFQFFVVAEPRLTATFVEVVK